MSFNQHGGCQNLTNETAVWYSSGARISNNGQQVSDVSIVNSNQYVLFDSHLRRNSAEVESSNLHQGLIPVAHGSDYQDSGIQSSSTQTPTTKQPPALSSIAATSGIPVYQGPTTLGLPHSWNSENISAPRSPAKAYVNRKHWISISNNNPVTPLNWLHLPSTHLVDNPNYPWNEYIAAAPINPHPVVSATVRSAEAACHPSTFTPGQVSARNRELMDGSAPLETAGRQPRTPNPLGAVGDYHPAYSRYYVTKFEYFTARHQARISNAQTEDTRLDINGESDSVGIDTPDSVDEAELYDSSVKGDETGVEDEGEEQDLGRDTEAMESEESLTNGLNAER